MKEKIYTIPVNEAFDADSECALCVLAKNLEKEYIEYILGPSLMEPDGRMETNDKGFCKEHFHMLYENKQLNILGLGLIIDTHIVEQTGRLEDLSGNITGENSGLLKGFISSKNSDNGKQIDKIIDFLDKLEKECVICQKLNYTMDRYYDVIFHLWVKETEFKNKFNNKKGFCLTHFKEILAAAKKYLNQKYLPEFLKTIIPDEINNLNRIQEDINWFTKKFDYRYNDSPWKNSKDAVPRSIEKISGYIKDTINKSK